MRIARVELLFESFSAMRYVRCAFHYSFPFFKFIFKIEKKKEHNDFNANTKKKTREILHAHKNKPKVKKIEMKQKNEIK